MDRCKYTSKLADYFDHALTESQRAEIETHLRTCDFCRQQLQNWKQLDSVLTQYNRPEPSPKIMKSYRRRLEQLFIPEPRWKTFKDKVRDWLDISLNSRSIGWRIAKATIVLIIGIFIGQYLTFDEPEKALMEAPPAIITSPVSSTDKKIIKSFIVESEILLLGISNDLPKNSIDSDEIIFNKEIAQKLLSQTSFIQERTVNLNIPGLVDYLNKLEFLLLELANMDDEELIHTFKEIRAAIKDRKLLYETKQWQMYLTESSSDEQI